MILIDTAFWTSVGVESFDGNDNGTQYDFYNSMVVNSVAVNNQYDFFLNSTVDSVVYYNQHDWYKAIGVFHSEPIYDQYTFMQNVTFDGVNAVGNQYDFFKYNTPLAFSIAHSFLLDGVDEDFSIPNADLVGLLQGAVDVTFNFVIRPDASEAVFTLWGNGATTRGIYIVYSAGLNRFGIEYQETGGGARLLRFPANSITLGSWNFISLSVDTAGDTGFLRVNGVNKTISAVSMTDDVRSNTDDFTISKNVAGFSAMEGEYHKSSIIDGSITLLKHQDWYALGLTEIDDQDFFGTDCKYFFNSDNSGSTAQFSVLDSVNSITATSTNLEDADKTTTIPY